MRAFSNGNIDAVREGGAQIAVVPQFGEHVMKAVTLRCPARTQVAGIDRAMQFWVFDDDSSVLALVTLIYHSISRRWV
jgi:hypothetical protein